MPTLLCTARYRKTFALPGNLAPPDADEGALGPWYANTLNVGSQRFLHYMSGPSLLSVVIPLRERRTAEQRFARALGELLIALGADQGYAEREELLLSALQYGRASDQSKLGSLRDQAYSAPYPVRDGLSILEINVHLAQTPCGPMGYASPRAVAPALLEAWWRRAG